MIYFRHPTLPSDLVVGGWTEVEASPCIHAMEVYSFVRLLEINIGILFLHSGFFRGPPWRENSEDEIKAETKADIGSMNALLCLFYLSYLRGCKAG